ncbi:uncharacterized protein [Halyomorpha halys]|uniref:uncharacterized protein n=1 Tax=Halyomorpha halys TaxID=286706 RepID=UPI0006D5050D|nr:glucose-6-phosphate 1-epimerase [Halyomorpha halys]
MAAPTSVVVLDRGNNTTCTVNLHGATVVSWRVNNQEQIFVSKQSVFDGRRPIRGGIPLVFPQYGSENPQIPNHGFARVSRWKVEKPPEALMGGDVEAIFSLRDNEFIRTNYWNNTFRLSYRLILREKELHFIIGVYNPSKEVTITFNLLLHTYFKVPDVRRCQITGLHGCTFIDKTRIGVFQEGRESVTINEWTDRLYQNTTQEHVITNVVSGRKMRLQKYNFPDTVIWNPWSDHAKDVSDFGPNEYPNMICVKSGHVSNPVVLHPGTAFEASQILQVM